MNPSRAEPADQPSPLGSDLLLRLTDQSWISYSRDGVGDILERHSIDIPHAEPACGIGFVQVLGFV